MCEKKCAFLESCKLFNDKVSIYSNEEYEILNDFREFKKFVDCVIIFFFSHFSLEELISMKLTIVKFIIDNQKLFGFYTIYSNSIYVDLVDESLSELE